MALQRAHDEVREWWIIGEGGVTVTVASARKPPQETEHRFERLFRPQQETDAQLGSSRPVRLRQGGSEVPFFFVLK
jgi:hypothetical protein